MFEGCGPELLTHRSCLGERVSTRIPSLKVPKRHPPIHHQCREVLPLGRFQRQRRIKIRVLRAQDFYTPLALKTTKGQHFPALVVYKNQSPNLEAQIEKLQ